MKSISSQTPKLSDTIDGLPTPSDLPLPLPPAHLTSARLFNKIVQDGCISPTSCKYFKEPILYFFYGGVFYRPKSFPTQNASELPVAFLFSPRILTYFSSFFPFDTGAIESGKVGKWSTDLQPIDPQFKINGIGDYSALLRMVYHIFGTNNNYLKGSIASSLKHKPYPLPVLYDYFNDDLTSHGVDHRQCVIECHCKDNIDLSKELLWIAFPEMMTDIFGNLYSITKPYIPEYYAYESHRVFNPSEVAAVIEKEAHSIIKRYVALP